MARHRRRFVALAALAVVSVTAACVAAVALAEREPMRWDLTPGSEHTLSARARAALARLDEPVEVVVLAPRAGLESRARRTLSDFLETLEGASGRVSAGWIDAAAEPEAMEAYLGRLAATRQEQLALHAGVAERSIGAAAELATELAALSPAIEAARDGLPPGTPAAEALTRHAALMRVRSRDLSAQAEAARAAPALTLGGVRIPPTDRLRSALRPALRSVAEELAAAGRDLAALPKESPGAAGAIAGAQGARDRALVAADALDRLPVLDVLAVARAAEADAVVIVSSGRSAAAVRLSSLFPRSGGEADGPMRFAGEELVTTALGTITTPEAAPVVALVHAVSPPLLDDPFSGSGRPATADAAQFFGELIDRLQMRGVGVCEWPVAHQKDRPVFPGLDSRRPVVWVIVPVAATAPGATAATDALAPAVSALIEAGESVLLTLEPSALGRIGEVDPLAAAVAGLGIEADTSRPIMQTVRLSGGGEAAWPELHAVAAREPGPAHPIAEAIGPLTVYAPWPCALRLDESAGSAAKPLLQIAAGPGTWGESQWLAFRAAPRQQRLGLPGQPTPDPARDAVRAAGDGPWIIAAAAQRRREDPPRDQRVVVVAASGWFFDPVAEEAQVVDGRPVRVNPGNGELFDASLAWLAHQDDLIAPGPRALEVSRIRAMSPSALSALRWAVILAPPVVVLLAGALVRALRG